ncbi:MAG: hypothetical protein D6786_00645 [Gammaproteobacteria bacterium]|nr:MAG: hypothetical protein D6786_00645 [Gammaproteobacteria bacterium]
MNGNVRQASRQDGRRRRPDPEFTPWVLASQFVDCWSELGHRHLQGLVREQLRNWRHWLELRRVIPPAFPPLFPSWPSPEPVALVLTASSDLCQGLLEEGYRLLLIHLPHERERTREWCRSRFPGRPVSPVECDLEDSAEAEALLRRVWRDYGVPSLILIDDGITREMEGIQPQSPDGLLGWIYNLLQASLPVLDPRSRPRIRFVLAEETARVLEGFTRQLENELQDSGILIETGPELRPVCDRP